MLRGDPQRTWHPQATVCPPAILSFGRVRRTTVGVLILPVVSAWVGKAAVESGSPSKDRDVIEWSWESTASSHSSGRINSSNAIMDFTRVRSG